jgi:hypothetical protein
MLTLGSSSRNWSILPKNSGKEGSLSLVSAGLLPPEGAGLFQEGIGSLEEDPNVEYADSVAGYTVFVVGVAVVVVVDVGSVAVAAAVVVVVVGTVAVAAVVVVDVGSVAVAAAVVVVVVVEDDSERVVAAGAAVVVEGVGWSLLLVHL